MTALTKSITRIRAGTCLTPMDEHGGLGTGPQLAQPERSRSGVASCKLPSPIIDITYAISKRTLVSWGQKDYSPFAKRTIILLTPCVKMILVLFGPGSKMTIVLLTLGVKMIIIILVVGHMKFLNPSKDHR